jgi:putative transcriptional regulator
MASKAKSKTPTFDWRRVDSLTEGEIYQRALCDPDAQPLTSERVKRMKRTPQVKVIRRALRLSQEEFAQTFRIPIGTLRDWEQGRVEPDQAARAYLKVIARNPKAVREALEAA